MQYYSRVTQPVDKPVLMSHYADIWTGYDFENLDPVCLLNAMVSNTKADTITIPTVLHHEEYLESSFSAERLSKFSNHFIEILEIST